MKITNAAQSQTARCGRSRETENSESSFEWQIAIQREAARLASAVLAVRKSCWERLLWRSD